MPEYHSALSNAHTLSTPPLDRWEGEKGLMLAWDVAKQGGLPPEFNVADVLYAEPPFPAGWKVFYDRIGKPPAAAYRDFIGLLSSFFFYRPGVMILSKPALGYLRTAPTAVEQVLIHEGGKGYGNAAWFGLSPSQSNFSRGLPRKKLQGHKSSQDVILELAEQFSCVGDFCAGYGNTGRIFAEQGKRFVMSDLEPRCVGYVAEHASEW